ncbi:response regulator [Geomonas sp.]|uniref:response regulator n=1 Tax=Geomonas sp. TaxID=2651584 RepID=UPI002B48042C|nr:response regulator [Geomonas sp.]HJV35001.1 response regulator [Geomonas sp.]
MNNSIMIVDDNEFIRKSVEVACQSTSFTIVPAESGAACLRQLEAGFRGVILMDVMMSGMDGWDTIREMVERGLYPGNVIVMLTGIGEPDLKMEGIQEYVTDYMSKPFGPDQLIESLRYYLLLLDALRA